MEKARLISMVVRSQLLGRGLFSREFARQLGCNADVLTNVISGCETSRRLRFRIEDKLGTAIWSSAEEFAARQRYVCGFWFGSLPAVTRQTPRSGVEATASPGAEANKQEIKPIGAAPGAFWREKTVNQVPKGERQ